MTATCLQRGVSSPGANQLAAQVLLGHLDPASLERAPARAAAAGCGCGPPSQLRLRVWASRPVQSPILNTLPLSALAALRIVRLQVIDAFFLKDVRRPQI